MRFKPVPFSLFATLIFALIVKTPFKYLYNNLGAGEYTSFLNSITRITLTCIFFFWVVTKTNLQSASGLVKHHPKNYWMLLLPLIYPGIWTYSNLNAGCFKDPVILITIVTAILYALSEELIFRGLIQGYLIKYSGKKIHHCILITTAFFSLGHFFNLTNHHFAGVLNQVIYAFFMGLLFSAIQLHVNNTWLLGIAHGLINFLFTGCSSHELLGETEEIPGFRDYLESIASLIILFSPILLIYWGLMRGYNKKIRNEKQR